MKLIRLLAATGVAALVLLAGPGAGSAMAANASTITSPNEIAHPSFPTLAGSVTQTRDTATVTQVDLKLTSDDGLTSENATLTYTRGAANSPVFKPEGDAKVSFAWPQKPRYNGSYTFSVNGKGMYKGGFLGNDVLTETSGERISFSLAIPPAKPTGVAAGMDDSSEVTVTWAPNPEPDLVGYIVKRSYQGASAKDVGDVAPSAKPKFTEDLTGAPPGAYKYEVKAVRRSCPQTSCDRLEGPVSAQSMAVTVRATPGSNTTTTSTTIKKPGTGGTGGGGTGGGGTGGGGTGGGGSGTGATGGTKTPTGKAAPKNNTNFTPGSVDLSQFGNLLGGSGKTTRTPGKVDEGTYDPEIKGYDTSENAVDSNNDDDSLITIGGASVPKPSDDWVRFIGAGSLATALLVHVLWFKQQVDSIPLEAVTD